MLEGHDQQLIAGTLCRFANARQRMMALEALGLDAADRDEVLTFLGGEGTPTELLDTPFQTDPTYTPAPTRFSDGSWRVFYAARDWRTAEAEVGYHVRKAAVGVSTPLYYQRLECDVTGNGYDLCPHTGRWPFLTDAREAEAYPPCQSLAREALGNGANGLLTLSARLDDGVNVPVFQRRALSAPRIVGAAAIIAAAGTYRVETRE